jgi:hypothetical protein
MKCLFCKKEAIERNGKFGKFFFCSGHGTISIQNNKVRVTGKMFEVARDNEIEERMYAEDGVAMQAPCINKSVELAMWSIMGYGLSSMDRFIEGGKEAALDEQDHWMNTPQR